LVWTDYPQNLHAPLLDLLHTFEVAFPLRNTQGQPLGASVIVPMLGSRKDALGEGDPGNERKAAVRAKGGAVQQLFVRYAARVAEKEAEEEKEEEGADSSGSGSSSSDDSDDDDGGPAATRFPPDFVGRLLARLHRFAMRDAGGDGGSCGGAWQGGCILGYADNKALLQVRNLGDDGDVLELDVWGVFPVTLRGIIHGAVQSLAREHYPGIALEVTIPCPCRNKKEVDGADGKPIKCSKVGLDGAKLKDTDGTIYDGLALQAGLARLVKAEAEAAAAQPGDAAVAALVAVRAAAEAGECRRCHQREQIRVLLPEDGQDGEAEVAAGGGAGGGVAGRGMCRDELLWAMQGVVAGYCVLHGVPVANGKDFLRRLFREWKLGSSVAVAAQRLWTSKEMLFMEDPIRTIEFCSLWSDVIRRDQASLARPSAMIARAINLNLVGAPTRDRAKMAAALARGNFPADGCLWRGGNFGVAGGAGELWKFFQPGAQYRAPQFLATSSNKATAVAFLEIAQGANPDRELVLWKVELDRRGAAEAEFRCRHVNLITQGHEDGEKEYLFSAFSVFTVTKVKPSLTPTRIGTPHIITIAPALDNKLQPGPDGRIGKTKWPPGLPLAPWC
jgi:hypothetical protein